jgi:UDP-2,3-diacylglucosamine pyrophosphatase LpxH
LLRDFLAHVVRQDAKLVILGDLLEFWQASLGAVIVRRMEILDWLTEAKATYVIGNHDIDLQALIGRKLLAHPFFDRMSLSFNRTIGEKKFKFLHGHEVDPFNCAENPGIGRAVTILAGVAEDFNGSPTWYGRSVERVLETLVAWPLSGWRIFARLTNFHKIPMPSVSQAMTPAQRPQRADDIIDALKRERANEHFDVAVVGHTHQAGRVGTWYYNSGSWVDDHSDFIKIDQQGNVELFKWTTAGPVTKDHVLDYQA